MKFLLILFLVTASGEVKVATEPKADLKTCMADAEAFLMQDPARIGHPKWAAACEVSKIDEQPV